jgi:hypothetical protein
MRLGHTKSSFQEEPSMRKNTKRSAVVAGAAAVIIGGGAAAWAFTGWNVDGSGQADATGASINKLAATVDFGQTTVYPGLEMNVWAAVANPNDFPVTINGGVTNKTFNSNDDACKTALTSSVVTLTVPNNPKVNAKANTQNVVAHAVFDSVPLACSGKHITATFDFSAVSTA